MHMSMNSEERGMKKSFSGYIESERLKRERDEEELQRIIDQNVHEVELAKLQEEKETKTLNPQSKHFFLNFSFFMHTFILT